MKKFWLIDEYTNEIWKHKKKSVIEKIVNSLQYYDVLVHVKNS